MDYVLAAETIKVIWYKLQDPYKKEAIKQNAVIRYSEIKKVPAD